VDTSTTRSFAINPGTIKLPLSDKRLGEVTVTVTNSSPAFKKGFVRYVPLGASDPKQARPDLAIDGEKERPFEKGAAQQFKIKVSAKPEVKDGTYQFRLDVANSADPEGDWTEGPAIEVTVPKLAGPVKPAGGGSHAWIFLVVGAAVLLIGGLVLFFVLHHSGDIDVPDLVGMTYPEAEKAALDAHLKIEVAGPDTEGNKEAKDDPKDAKPEEKKPDDHKPAEKKAGEKKDEKDASGKAPGAPEKPAPQGKVKSQDPAAHEKASADTVISVVLEKGDAPPDDGKQHDVVVPSVKGMTVEQAKLHLYDAGFTPKVGDPDFKGTTPGTINEQKPAPGTKAEKGSEVTITPEKENVQVTNLVGKQLKDAIFELNRLKLLGQVTYQSVPGPVTDHVIEQNPKASVRVEVGSTVTLTVPRGMILPVLPKEEIRHLVPATALMFAKPNTITGITVTPASPAFFHRSGVITISCHYSTSEGGRAKVTAMALVGGKEAPGSTVPIAVTDASGKGELKLSITLRTVIGVDTIRVQLIGSDGKVLDNEQQAVKYSCLPF